MVERIRYGPATVLDQVETRPKQWNTDTLEWEAATVTTEELLTSILAKLEEIRILLGGV